MSPRCPDCGAPLAPAEHCPACGLLLRGPVAARLWEVDQLLASLGAERLSLLVQLRRPSAPPTAAVRPVEATPRSAQNTLLGLGSLLLAAAVLVFAAVTYSHLGAGGRAAVLVLLTLLAGGAATALTRRSLTSSAEAVAGVALVLAVDDAWALRRAGAAPGLGLAAYAAVASGLLAVLAGAWAAVTRLQVVQATAVGLAQGVVVLGLLQASAGAAAASLALALLAVADGATARVLPSAAKATATVFASAWSVAVLAAAGVAYAGSDPAGCLGLLVLAAGAALLTATGLRAAGAVPVLLAGAAFVASRPSLTDDQRPLVLSAVALLVLPACALLQRRREAVAGALAVAAAAVLLELVPLAEALGGPATWVGHAWSWDGGAARAAVAVGTPWDGTVVTLLVVLAAALAVLAAGFLLEAVEGCLLPGGLLLGVAAVVFPLGLATSYPVAVALQLGAGAALCAGALRRRAVAPGGLLVLAVATTWSLADQRTTLVVLAVAALAVAPLSPGLALVLAGSELAAVGASQGLHADQVGGLLLLAVAVAAALGAVLRGARRSESEAAALLLGAASVALGAASVALAAADAGWLSWSLAGCGLLALAVAVQPDRRLVGLGGALLLSASSWVRLADASVHAPEPYVLPLAAVALSLGHLRRRAHPSMGSVEAYAGGLLLALVPSLLRSLVDPEPFRGLLVLLAASAVVVVGAGARLRAPLAVGGAVAAVEAVHLLAPYAAALPRWLVLAAAGALLVGAGATYEQRLRDAARLRERFDALA